MILKLNFLRVISQYRYKNCNVLILSILQDIVLIRIFFQAHRLVVTTCTEYFMQLEQQQKEKDENFNGVITMPSDMPYECVKSIIRYLPLGTCHLKKKLLHFIYNCAFICSFMYTGQLEYWTSEQNALYRTAQKMNMTVLTKLLDAQFNTSSLQVDTPKTSPISKPSAKPVITSISSPLPEPLPGRKYAFHCVRFYKCNAV